jgi:hypothetical protein
MPHLARTGRLLIETLHQHGRTPAGTRAVVPCALHDDATGYCVEYTLASDEPRPVQVSCHFAWDYPGRARFQVFRRGLHEPFDGDVTDYALLNAIDSIERIHTTSGQQRYRVLRAEWE